MEKNDSKKRIFIYSEKIDGCFYYRAEVFRGYTKTFIVNTNVDFKNNVFKKGEEVFPNLINSDLVVFIRPIEESTLLLFSLMKLLGKRVVYSNDDSFSSIDKKNPARGLKKFASFSNKFLKFSDAAITTTRFLKKEFRGLNQNVYVIPNHIDFGEFSCLYQGKRRKNIIKIGMVGSVTTGENLTHFLPSLKQIYDKNQDIKLVFFGGGDPKMKADILELFKDRIQIVENVNIQRYPQKLANLDLDIALIPRKDSYFNRCKSDCKYLEMGALKIAVIAQGFRDKNSPYQDFIIDGENGYIAQRGSDWVRKTELLVRNKKLLNKIKENQYQYVKNNRDISSNIDQWDSTFREILKNKPQSVDKKVLEDLYFTHKEIIDKRNREIKKLREKNILLNQEIISLKRKLSVKMINSLKRILKWEEN